MTDYINRDDALSYLRELLPLGDAVTIDPAEEIKIVESIPAADVEPVRRGRWVDALVRDWRCSECGSKVPEAIRFDGYCCTDKLNFCPHCGAEMEGAESE